VVTVFLRYTSKDNANALQMLKVNLAIHTTIYRSSFPSDDFLYRSTTTHGHFELRQKAMLLAHITSPSAWADIQTRISISTYQNHFEYQASLYFRFASLITRPSGSQSNVHACTSRPIYPLYHPLPSLRGLLFRTSESHFTPSQHFNPQHALKSSNLSA
jgi:hypothetical protein